MKKAILFILWLLISLVLPACATDGLTRYDRIEAKAAITGDNSKLEAYEKKIERAGMWFEHKSECTKTAGQLWFCPRGAAAKDRRRNRKPISTDTLVRDYDQERWASCGCITASQMRDITRRISRY